MSKTRNDWIQTFTGRQFFPLTPRVEDVSLADIAHALSQICRFTGHCHRFYSVAEHSVRVSRLAASYVPEAARRVTIARWGLLHDASEAYLCDVAAPIKRTAFLDGYRVIEAKLERTIARAAGLPWPMPDEVKRADLVMLATEAAQLLGRPPAPWNLPYPALNPAPDLGWDPLYAERMFIEEIKTLSLIEVTK